MTAHDLPEVNVALNSMCTILLFAGFVCIKRERKRGHIACMLGALLTSAVFLVCYLYYHYQVGHVEFTHQGTPRTIYFFILITHIILAMVLPFLVVFTLIPAIRSRFDRHRKIARWTWPIWMYVSITGVLVYLFSYQWFPPAG
jgi:putative membrane protein